MLLGKSVKFVVVVVYITKSSACESLLLIMMILGHWLLMPHFTAKAQTVQVLLWMKEQREGRVEKTWQGE